MSQNVNIRGIGLSSGSPSVQPGVPVYLDALVPSDGMSVLDRLRKDDWGKDVPVIILTNLMATDGYKKLAEDFAVYDYVVKSDRTLEEVVQKVEGALKAEK